jgi:hypothetical protein
VDKSSSIAKLAGALVEAQKEMQNPAFDSTNPHFKNRFASLAAVREVVIPVLNKHGLSLSQWPISMVEGGCGCVNLLMHASGEWIEEVLTLPLDKNNAQGAGSAITYARRYSLQAIAGVVADEDDDANAASTPAKKKASENGPATPTSGVWDSLDEAMQRRLQGLVDECRVVIEEGNPEKAVRLIEEENLDADQKVALWSRFDSKERAAMKKVGK